MCIRDRLINGKGEFVSNNILRKAIQKVATGPEFSKNISVEDSYDSMMNILDNESDSIQAAIYLIAMRMKRETMDENIGSLKALIDKSEIITADVDELLDIAEPYNGFLRNTPLSAFLPSVFSSIGIPCLTHGVETVGPKFGLTAKKILKASGINVDNDLQKASDYLSTKNIGWTYIDQEKFCKPLHDLIDLRTRMVKRTILTTIEVLVGPIRAKNKTHLLTGYVHAAYPPVYSELAKVARGSVLTHTDWVVVNAMRQNIRQKWRKFFENYDVILSPTTMVTAFKHNHDPVHERKLIVNGRDQEYLRVTLWAGPAVMAGLPSTNVPIGFSQNNLPIGMQIVGPYLEDKTCIEVAKIVRDLNGGFIKPSGF